MDEVAFGRYRLLSLIGEGGMGKVYKAHDTVIDRDVAIKVLPTELGAEPGYRDRFRREARIAARLSEPHIIPVHDTGEIDGRLYLVMPVIDGVDLQALLKRDGPMSPQRAVDVIEQLAAALDAAHAAGLVHRDVKPSNALLTGRDFVYLIDFGIAHDSTASKLTRTGMVVGSWAYMAPERFTTGSADASGDIYALACVLHECLTGAQPYPGDSLEQQYGGHVYASPPRPSILNPDVPAGFDDVIAAGMAKEPAQRYATAHDLAAAARHALVTTPSRDRRRTPTMLDPTQFAVRPAQDPTQFAVRPAVLDPTRPAPGLTQRDHQVPPLPPAAPSPRGRADAALPAASPPRQAAGLTTRRSAPQIPTPASPVADSASAQIDRAGSPSPRRRRNRLLVVTVAAVLVVATAVAVGYLLRPHTAGSPTPTAQPAPAGGVTAQPAPPPTPAVHPTPPSGATALPFTGLNRPGGVAVDTRGNVFVADAGTDRVLELAAGAGGPTVMPFGGLGNPSGVAVDAGGAVYVTNAGNNRLLKLTAGASSTTELPITGLNAPRAVAVDAAGNLYIAAGDQVLKLAAGSTNTTEVPFTGLGHPSGVAVDSAGAVYVTDTAHARVLKVAADTNTPTALPFADLNNPNGVAVDSAGNVYVTDSGTGRVMKLAASSTTPTVLPVTGLDRPAGVAVDDRGNLYLTDSGNNRVLKLPAG